MRAIADAGMPRAFRSRRPPTVTWPCAPTRAISTSTWGEGGMVPCAAESSSGPLEKNQTGIRRRSAILRSTNLRAAGCHRLAYSAPPTITPSKPRTSSDRRAGWVSTITPRALRSSASMRAIPSVPPRFDPQVIRIRMPRRCASCTPGQPCRPSKSQARAAGSGKGAPDGERGPRKCCLRPS